MSNEPRRRIAMYGPFNEKPTGPTRVTTGLSNGMGMLGYDVDLFTYGDRTTHPHPGVTVRSVPYDGGSVRNFVKIHEYVGSHVRNGDYDLFHAVGGFTRKADVNTVQGAFTELDLVRWSPLALPPIRELLGGMLYSVLKARGIRNSRKVVATSPVSARQLEGYVRESPVRTIPLGIEEEKLRPPSARDGKLEVLFAGRIEPRKGQHRVLQHLDPESDDYAVDVVGGITDRSYYRRFSDRWSERVHGFVSEEALEDAYVDSDVVVMPSYHETFGLVGLEAIAKGCIVVATDACGFAQLERVSRSPGVFVVEDGAEAAETVSSLAGRDDLDELKRYAYETAKRLTWTRIAEEYDSIYRAVIDDED